MATVDRASAAILLQVAGESDYRVGVCTRHAVLEQQRASCFQQLLQGPLTMPEQLLNLGELLFQVHAICSDLLYMQSA